MPLLWLLALLARPLAFSLCTELDGRPVCAQTDDYFAFTRTASLAPLYVASGAYCGYAALRGVLDVGHARASSALTSSAVYALLWLALGALEIGVVGGAVDASRASWAPGFALLGAPLSAFLGLCVAWRADADAPLLALGALAPLAELVAPRGYEWALSFAVLAALCALARTRATLPLLALWLSAWRYSALAYIVLLNAASGALIVAALVRQYGTSRDTGRGA